jgi:hypothetical protein
MLMERRVPLAQSQKLHRRQLDGMKQNYKRKKGRGKKKKQLPRSRRQNSFNVVDVATIRRI